MFMDFFVIMIGLMKLQKSMDFFLLKMLQNPLVQDTKVECQVLLETFLHSFFGNKTITTGEGGMVLCKNLQHYNKIKKLKNQGNSKEHIS